MFCDACVTSVQPGQAYCGRCGKQKLGPAVGRPARRRMQNHLQLVAIVWFALSAFNAIGGIVLYIVANTLLAPRGNAGAPSFLRPLLTVLAIIVLGGAALGFSAGWGLLHREPWARSLSLVLAFLVLFINIPVGTLVGAYTLWVLLPGESQQEYESLVGPRAA